MRITGGTYRSRALQAPKGQATRPTTDRVREALFGILTSAGGLSDARILDLYAGTGALALEAISRGAASAVVVESAREALGALRANVASLGVSAQVEVMAADVAAAVGRIARSGPFDCVFADPPWAKVDAGDAVRVLSELARAGAFAEAGRVVLEHSSRTPPPDVDGLVQIDFRRYGDTALTFYKPAILGPLSPVASKRGQAISE
jgi:16S rRNA (guanine966-N2)-methyltransferase